MLGPGGFDGGRDIIGITVNRWSHGYAYTPSRLYDDVEAMSGRQEAMKAKLGAIAFANSDTGWDAYAHTAMAEAVRAVGELIGEGPQATKPTRTTRSCGGSARCRHWETQSLMARERASRR